MTLKELEEKRPSTITVQEAAEIMDVTPRFLQLALQQGRFPFGVGVEMGRWAYYINTERFLLYMTGADLGGKRRVAGSGMEGGEKNGNNNWQSV